MSNKRLVTSAMALTIVILVAILFVSNYFSSNQKTQTSPTPTPYVYPYLKPTPSYSIGLSQWELNVTQGETFHIGITISSFLDKVIKFTPEVRLYAYGNTPLDPSQDYHNIFNATFTQAQLIMRPYGNATTILTVNMAQDAQPGRYLFYVTHSSSDSGLGVMTEDALTITLVPKTN